MSDVIIKVDNLSKTFKLFNHPKDRLKEALSPFRKKYHHEYHALKDISFEIKKGESVAILGKNGAGKSTLLKILTGVLTPTSGKVMVRGRIAALLELGSGFNPELSGLENIYFQGAIIGFSKEEMEKKINEIVQFADIGEFINQPVKTYSSGMFARLAFSVATNTNPDILIIDEVLSVGDIRFQIRCIKRIEEMKSRGCSILFVSHSSSQVEAICNNAIWLNNGELKEIGPTNGLVRRYLNFMAHGVDCAYLGSKELIQMNNKTILENNSWINIANSQKTLKKQEIDITRVRVRDSDGNAVVNLFSVPQKIFIEFEVKANCFIEKPLIGIGIMNSLNEPVIHFNSQNAQQAIDSIETPSSIYYEFSFTIPALKPSEYIVSIGLDDGIITANELFIHVYDAWKFTVSPTNPVLEQAGYVQILDVNTKYHMHKREI